MVAALLASLGIAIASSWGFLLTRSASMLAEAVHSVADSGNQALLLLGQKRSCPGTDRRAPVRLRTRRYFWAFVVALILFSLGGMFAIYEGVTKIRDPRARVAVDRHRDLLAAIVLESASFRTAIVESRRAEEPGMSWWGFIRRSSSPSCPWCCWRISARWWACASRLPPCRRRW